MTAAILLAAVSGPAGAGMLADPQQCRAGTPAPTELATLARKAAVLAERARSGENLSQVTVGWYVADLLAELADRDADLARQLRPDGRLVVDYLVTRFQSRPKDEIRAVETLAAAGNRPLRLAARYALEALRHIPDDDDPPPSQAEDRDDLAAALACVRGLLGG
ncbi:MAG: hypothetical protein ACM31L_08580 [Actinomycetota bacterium]